ncbi:MAG: methyltransferase domain-containing protein [Candidatus Bathyarchaeota archaeon]|jgi:SAM-dependent methyltransferase|nr:methyltransferase domain-containing protein [Candidatus Bathyarchaeota archaeon]
MIVKNKTLGEMTKREIEDAVKQKYSEVATNPCDSFNFPVGKQFAIAVGYPQNVVDALPDSLVESFTGANNPQPFINLQKGETVLDLGCGAGLDMYFYAKAVGSEGKVIGVDISEEMVLKARKNMEQVNVTNVEIKCGHADEIPLDDNAVDVVASNGIYNLSPNTEAVLREVLRVLKPGGRTVFCEIVLKKALPKEIRKNITDWFRCIGGALPKKGFVALMQQVGFTGIEVFSTVRNARTGHELAICANMQAFKAN